MKKLRVIALILLLVLLFASCRSIYIDPEESSEDLSEIIDGEYFTTGNVYSRNDLDNGFVYEDYWIYREDGPQITYKHEDENKSFTSQSRELQRFVKVNARTGIVSSLCLDPVCNHSPGSDCIMVAPMGKSAYSQGISGDWFIFCYWSFDHFYGSVNDSYVYNLKTGELVQIFSDSFDNNIMTKLTSRYEMDGMMFYTKNTLDYSESGYKPSSNKPLSEYKAKTITTICMYDFNKKTTEELFIVPNDYGIAAITNFHFYFTAPDGGIYSCDRNGKEWKKEETFDFVPYFVCGQYAYQFANGLSYNHNEPSVTIYNIETDEKKTIKSDFKFISTVGTRSGILMGTWTTIDDWMKMNYSMGDYQKLYPELSSNEFQILFSKELSKCKYKGKGQIYLLPYDGNEPSMIFEKENMVILPHYEIDGYLYCFISKGDSNSDFSEIPIENEGRSYINIKTGEITHIPYLDLVLPEEGYISY